VRIQHAYQDDEVVIRRCRGLIRVPEVWYGDYLAALGAARVGERRLKELASKYGTKLLDSFVGQWLDYSERLMAHAVAKLPKATLAGAGRHDPLPGLPDGVPVRVAIEVDPDRGVIDVDLRDNIDCVPAGVNLSEACAVAGVIIGVFNCLDPQVPRNEGSFRRIRTHLRENCVVGIPRFPASTSMATTNVINRLINATQAAFAEIGDGYGLAEGGVSMGVGFGVVSGFDPRRAGAPFVNQLLMGNNGGPGSPTCDGWVTYALPDCAASVYHDSVEITEHKYPLRVHSARLLADSGGAGRFRGGPASRVEYGPVDEPILAIYFADGQHHPPQGVRGGLPGLAASAAKRDSLGVESALPPIGGVELQPGERIVGIECGGGGYGRPTERDPEHVRHDVLEGWVSLEQASAVYGVVFAEEADSSLRVDIEATTNQRSAITTGKARR
jgi:N-methylhydantoinase B